MLKRILPLLLLAGLTASLTAQDKSVTLEEIWNGSFTPKRLQLLRSMNDGLHYTVLELNSVDKISSIDKYDYATDTKIETVLSSEMANVPFFTSYSFSDDESKVLIGTDIDQIYRRSRKGVYHLVLLEQQKLMTIANEKIQEPTLSPDGTKVAYAWENNLFIKDLETAETQQITSDGEINAIINGITDWVYEEEFAFVRAFEWNSDGSRIAYLRFDEQAVPEFSMDMYGTGLYPTQHVFKYPKAGEVNADVALKIYNLKSGETADIDLGEAYYIPRIKWMNDPDILTVQVLNRHQNHLRFLGVNADSNSAYTIMEERDPAYVDITDDLTFLADDRFIWTSEASGNNHIYLYSKDGTSKQQITEGPWEVTRYYGYDDENKRIYYQSSERSSIQRDVYSIGLNGKRKKQLTERAGFNSASFSTDFIYFINTHSSAATPPVYELRDANSGDVVRTIEDNNALKDKLSDYTLSPKEFSTLEINGNTLNMYMIKPADFDPSKKYPLFMFQYSGPGSQQVADRWMGTNDYWHQLLASRGYVIACVDGRGTGLKGRDFKKVTQLELGKYEVEDQIEAGKVLSDLPFIDESRTGIWGWSYGGFMSTNCLLKGSDVFEMAIAVAPVTSWRFYDTIYTERYMQTPQENPTGYDDNSPLNYPELLKGDYLLVHGSGDDNVHVQNTTRMVEALIQANKPFEWAIYPDKAHSIRGGNSRLHLFTKMTRFVEKAFEIQPELEVPDSTPIKGK